MAYQLPIPQESPTEMDWLIKLRTFISVAELSALVPGYFLGIATGRWFWLYLGLFLFNPALNAVLLYGRRKKPDFFQESKDKLLSLSLMYDAGHLFILLALTGGWNNPFAPILPLFAAVGGLVLSGRMAIGYGCYLAVLVTLLMGYFTGPIPLVYSWTQDLVNLFVVLFLIGVLVFLSTNLINRIVAREKAYHLLAQERLRLTRLQAIGALSSGVCHQLASPLNNIKLRVNRLGRVMEESRDLLSMQNSIAKCEAALRKLADIQLDSGRFPMEPMDCAETVKEITLKWQEENPGTPIQLDLPEDFFIKIPTVAFCQSIMDLLDNGKEAGPTGSKLVVVAEKEGDFCLVSIIDKGSGFPETTLQYIGRPFNSHNEAGSGLGLYHADLVCQLLGGKLLVANIKTGGSRVTMKFLSEGGSLGQSN